MNSQTWGLFATTLVVLGQLLLTKRGKSPFLLMSMGNALWFVILLYRTPVQIDLLLTNAIFASISIRNLFVGPEELRQKKS